MTSEQIAEIGMTEQGGLYVVPVKEKFPLIYRAAMEVNWDENRSRVYGPKPRKWTYLNWYRQIIKAVSSEYGVDMIVSGNTKWIEIPANVKGDILVHTNEGDA